METLFYYFLKVNGLLIVFYLSYYLLLRKETFFQSNRWFLFIGILSAFLLPLLTYTIIVWINPEPMVESSNTFIPVTNSSTEMIDEPFNWNLLMLYGYFLVSIVFLIQLAFELFSFLKIVKNGVKIKTENIVLVETNKLHNPFSFFNYLVFNKSKFSEEELEMIIIHERIHIKQKHSIDVLLSKILCLLLWINPIAWFYRKAMLENLEFIADYKTATITNKAYQYQKTLLKVVVNSNQLSITNQFYQSLIKKRIVMLNTNQSQKKNIWKYATILPLLVGFMLLFQVETVSQIKEDKKNIHLVSVDYNHVFTATTSDSEIKELEESFSDENQKLKITNVKRNKKGEIIEIKLEFSSKNNSKAKKIKIVKGDKPINPIKIFIRENEKEELNFGFEEANENYLTSNNEDAFIEVDNEHWTFDKIEKDGKKVKLIINGKLQTEKEKIKISNDEELDVLKELDEKELKSKYNIDKKDGEIYYEITTKKEIKSTNSDAVHDVEVASEYSEDENFSHIDKIKRDKLVDAKKALILFNGKEINYEDLDKIDTKTISSSGNTIASHAMKKYGEKGKNGVIFINTKTYDLENSPFLKEYENKKQIELKAQENSKLSKEELEERRIKREQLLEERKKMIEERKSKTEERRKK